MTFISKIISLKEKRNSKEKNESLSLYSGARWLSVRREEVVFEDRGLVYLKAYFGETENTTRRF